LAVSFEAAFFLGACFWWPDTPTPRGGGASSGLAWRDGGYGGPGV